MFCYNNGMGKNIYTEDELKQTAREELVRIILSLQKTVARMMENQELILEQISILRQQRFGRHSEKLERDAGGKYAEALKAIKDKEKRKGTLAYDALKQIGAIYKLDNELAGLEPLQNGSTGGSWS